MCRQSATNSVVCRLNGKAGARSNYLPRLRKDDDHRWRMGTVYWRRCITTYFPFLVSPSGKIIAMDEPEISRGSDCETAQGVHSRISSPSDRYSKQPQRLSSGTGSIQAPL